MYIFRVSIYDFIFIDYYKNKIFIYLFILFLTPFIIIE